ncbi:MAG: 4-(cytidine 5'-diphospho)-2-C-methyl-D-erythritol kinase [Candidatus Iainarchaeum archaeon]|uniref:4-(cytidine 5'-diphospho)-2-C-methyl-D-erythritol kinase n=1 Tax=Candidatus Iainarchaeum sp. TaxID=3101447 RepID=A0A7T9DIY5_9ARCH|nr:MAG: 4-(cytidine 5'-diphospho)-2-C-methyl-D-erythritol kinase [Candidatus Diapherotrites archaeon]
MPTLTLHSPAKLNLVLDLLRKRDDGFHEVEFVMQELNIHDNITIETLPHTNQIQIECTDPTVPRDHTNTCWKAVELMQHEAQKQSKPLEGVRIFIEKHIPSAGGLGGGSSNAATVLKGLNQLWELHLSNEKLAEMAGHIGSDVPFFIYGGTCIARGRGEIISPLKEKCPTLHLAFIVPPVKVPEAKTKWIYGNFNVANVSEHYSIKAMQHALESNDPKKVVEKMGNVFENLTLKEYEPVFELIARLNYMPGIRKAMLAGAGPTVVAVCEDEKVASQVIAPFRMQGWVAFATTTH